MTKLSDKVCELIGRADRDPFVRPPLVSLLADVEALEQKVRNLEFLMEQQTLGHAEVVRQAQIEAYEDALSICAQERETYEVAACIEAIVAKLSDIYSAFAAAIEGNDK